ncbi:hypothetical protein A0127_06630 [Thermococcus peptonophilus]|uniref:Glycosyl transferase n=1 Tax=Thermococcus peptonophilus TaxID=53952 RepID=A0A142CVR8_9EURY|nr:hypothetical protein A0127_06630 [Thermococcus peptonophilus]
MPVENVIIIMPYSEKPIGGRETVAYNTVVGLSLNEGLLKENGLFIEILSLSKRSPGFKRVAERVTVRRVPVFIGVNDLIMSLRLLQMKGKLDLLHDNDLYSCFFSCSSDIPVVYTLHSMFWKVKTMTRLPMLKLYHWYNIRKFFALYPRLRGFVAISRAIINELKSRGIYEENIPTSVIENPVNVDLFKIPEREISDPPTIMYPALIRPLKNQLTLLRAIKLLREEGFRVNLELIGSIKDMKYYFKIRKFIKEEGLKDSVRIVPGVSYDTMVKYYARSDIVVVPSLQESFGMVVPEAMAAGRPIVASNIPAFREKIENRRDGILIDPKDPEDISEKIGNIINSYSLQRKIARRAKRKAVNRWHPKIVARKLIGFYLEVSMEGNT